MYIVKSEKIICRKFQSQKKDNSSIGKNQLMPYMPSDTISMTRADIKSSDKKDFNWQSFSKTILLKLFEGDYISIETCDDLKSIYKKLILHEINHTKLSFLDKEST